MLNVDFKIMTGIHARRLRKVMPHTLAAQHLVGEVIGGFTMALLLPETPYKQLVSPDMVVRY